MSSIGIPGLIICLIVFLIPLVVTIFIFIWLYQIKVTNETQVKQNNEIIRLLEDLNNK